LEADDPEEVPARFLQNAEATGQRGDTLLARLFGRGQKAASALEDTSGDASDALGGAASSLTSALGAGTDAVASSAAAAASTATTAVASGLASAGESIATATGEALAAATPAEAIPGIGELVMGAVALATALGIGLSHKHQDAAQPPDVTFQAGA
jgi:hypothetical protein